MRGQRLIVDPYDGILDAVANQANGNVAMAVIGVHHIGTSGTVLALAINHNT